MPTSTGTATAISCARPWLATVALKMLRATTTPRYEKPVRSLKKALQALTRPTPVVRQASRMTAASRYRPALPKVCCT
ncbi:hypothetical protein D3C72_1871470 [compost metagenome]